MLDVEDYLEEYCEKHGIDFESVSEDKLEEAVEQIENNLEMFLSDERDSGSLFFEATFKWKKVGKK